MRKIVFTIVYMCLCQQLPAQEQKTAEQVLAEMDSPTFVPTVKVGKVMHEGDSIQYMEMNNVYVYPELTFKNKKQVYAPREQREEGAAHRQGGKADADRDHRVPGYAA